MNHIKILYDERTGDPERIDANKTRESKECNIYHYWYFLNKGFMFQANVGKRCHDLLMMSMNLSNIAIFNTKIADYLLY